MPHPIYGPTQAAFPYEWLVLAHASQLPKSFLTRNSQSSESLRTGTSSSQPRFTAWLGLWISKLSTTSSHLRWLYSSGRVAPGKTQVGADIGLYCPGNPRAYAPSVQLQIMLEHHHPAPAQLTLHGGWRLVVSSHRQSLWLTGLGKTAHCSANSIQGSTSIGG